MICPYCGKENHDDLVTCEFCTAPLPAQPAENIPDTSPAKPGEDSYVHYELPESLRNVADQVPPPPTTGIYSNKTWWFIGGGVLLIFVLACVAIGWGIYRYSDALALFTPPTMTPTFIPVPSATALPTAETTQASSVIYFDDFSDPNSGWDRVNESDFYTDYYQGAYRIIEYSDMADSWANPGDSLFGDVSIEVDATKNAGPDDNDFGVICRYQSVDAFYYAVISSDGYYGITKVTSEDSQLLGHDELLPSEAINLGASLNHIRFDCIGNQLILYANGIVLDQQTDSEYTYGNVGLIAGTYDIPGADILFDNFTVSQP